jgi:hypothetical protein
MPATATAEHKTLGRPDEERVFEKAASISSTSAGARSDG